MMTADDDNRMLKTSNQIATVVMGVIAHTSSVEMHGMSDRCRHIYRWSALPPGPHWGTPSPRPPDQFPLHTLPIRQP